MNTYEEFFLRILFRNKILEASGEAFQHLFSKVMVYADPRFRPITPWGNWGDGGNDGYIPEEDHYFQVYGPKSTTSAADVETAALKKAIDDFDKLQMRWKEIRIYSFVMNDRFNGTPAPIAQALQTLGHQRTVSALAFSMYDLLECFMKLDPGKRQDILGGAIPPGLGFDEDRLRERFVRMFQGLGNACKPIVGSDEYLELEKMVAKGWVERLPLGLYARSTDVNLNVFGR